MVIGGVVRERGCPHLSLNFIRLFQVCVVVLSLSYLTFVSSCYVARV